MVEKILKETYVNPKVELSQSDYNRLVSMATMNAQKIEKRAREIYEKEGVVKIEFDGRFITKRYGERETEHYKFDVICEPYTIMPDRGEKGLFSIPQKMRQRIATKTRNYVQGVFDSYFGEHLVKLNAIKELEAKQRRDVNRFIIVTLTGWLLALLISTMFLLFK